MLAGVLPTYFIIKRFSISTNVIPHRLILCDNVRGQRLDWNWVLVCLDANRPGRQSKNVSDMLIGGCQPASHS